MIKKRLQIVYGGVGVGGVHNSDERSLITNYFRRGGVRNPSAMNVAQLTLTKFKTPPKNEKQKSHAFVVTGFLRTAISILQIEHCS